MVERALLHIIKNRVSATPFLKLSSCHVLQGLAFLLLGSLRIYGQHE